MRELGRSLLGELGRRRAVELREQPRRLVEVEGADLDELLAGALAEPVRKQQMKVGARALREAGIRDLADEHVLELEGLLAADRGALLAKHEVAEEQVVEQRDDVLDIRGEVSERAADEDAAHDGRALDEATRRGGKPVDARGDQRLERVGDPLLPALGLLREGADRLLHEQRVSLGLRQHGLDVDRHVDLGGELPDERGAFGVGQCLELERDGAQAATAPRRAHVEQLGPGEADEEHRRRANPRSEVLDHLQQRLLPPVDVLEHEHERLCRRELLGPGANRPRDLLLAALAFDRLEHANRETEQVGDRLVLARVAQLLERLLDRVVVGDAGRGLDHLGDRPVGHALSVREAAAPEHGCALEPVDELAREPALANAGLAVERDERRASVSDGAGVRVLEQLELGLAADERRRQ